MRKTFQIKVDCAKCALYVKDAVRKLPEINDCSISFAVGKMYVDIKDGCSVADIKSLAALFYLRKFWIPNFAYWKKYMEQNI